MYNWPMHNWMDGGWPMGGLFWIAVVAIIGYGVFAVAQRGSGNSSRMTDGGSPALRTLDERYAKGEIDREDYLRRKRDILGKGEA